MTYLENEKPVILSKFVSLYQGCHIICRIKEVGLFVLFLRSTLSLSPDEDINQCVFKYKHIGSGRSHLVYVQHLDKNVPVHIALDSFHSSYLNLTWLSAYGGQPNLSGVWMYQRAMSVRLDIDSSPDFINNLLSINFRCMEVVTTPKPIHFLLI